MTTTIKATHKEIWVNHELLAYCEPFNRDCDFSGKITSTSDAMVTCSDCQTLVNLQTEITKELVQV